MTDRDVVEHVARLVGRAVVTARPREANYKVPYLVSIKGAAAVDLMDGMRAEMGASRRSRIDRVLAAWKRDNTSMNPRRRRSIRIALPAPHECGTSCQIAWLAGLLEGEGHFGMNRTGPHPYPLITLKMCSRDVVERAARVIDAPSIMRSIPTRAHWNVTYNIQIVGASAARWMNSLRPFMGQRRGWAIDAALAAYEPIRLVDPPDTCIVPGCDEPHRSRGLCHKHYMTWLRDLMKGRTPRVRPLR